MNELKKSIKSIATTYIVVWAVIFISIIVMFSMLRCDVDLSVNILDLGAKVLLITALLFFAGLAASIFGVCRAIQFKKTLKANNIAGGNELVWAFISLLASTILSMTSIFGCNLAFQFMVLGVQNIGGQLSTAAMLIFSAFPVLTYLGVRKIRNGQPQKYNALPSFDMVEKWTSILMIISIIISPLLMAYINADTKSIKTPVVYDIVAALLYLPVVSLFIRSIMLAQDSEILSAEDIKEIEQVAMPSDFRCAFQNLGKVFSCIWATIVLSLVLMTSYYLTEFLVLCYATWLIYVIGWCAILYGLWFVIRFNSLLSDNVNKLGGNLLVKSLIILSIVCALSFNTIYGANFILSEGYFDFGDIGESLEDMLSIDELDGFLNTFGIISLLLFTVFPILSFIGLKRLAILVPELKTANIFAGIMTVASTIFAPFILSIANTTLIDDSPIVVFYDFAALITYCAGIYLFTRNWQKCGSINIEYAETVEQNFKYEDNFKFNRSSFTQTFRTNKLYAVITSVAVVCVLLSLFFIVKLNLPHNSQKSMGINAGSLNEYVKNQGEDIEVEVISETSDSNDEVEVVEEYVVDEDNTEIPAEEEYVEPEVSMDPVREILKAPAVGRGAERVHFYKGTFDVYNKSFPIMVAFVEKNGRIVRAAYKNVNYKTCINLKFQVSEGRVTLTNSNGGENFLMELLAEPGNGLHGEMMAGDDGGWADLTPTVETFKF